MNPHQVIDIFKRSGVIDDATGDELLTEATNSGHSIDTILSDQGIATPEVFAQIIAAELGVDAVDLTGFEPQSGLLHQVPAGMARLHEVWDLETGNSRGRTTSRATAELLRLQYG
jgi:hypothetical protein